MQTVTLIIDKRREISVKYKKLLESEYSQVIISKNILSAMKFIQDQEPDIIIISDSIGDELDVYCQDIRAITYNMRPIIVATSKSAELSDKLKVLESGADDFISEPINSKEFTMRIKAHLRREFESNLDDRRLLPNRSYSMRALKRLLCSDTKWAVLLITIDNFTSYKEVYTKFASDKLFQTFSAIIASSLGTEDYMGEYSENEIIIITDEIKAEKVAGFITFAFDTVAEKFYSSSDLKRGFVISRGDNEAGKRSDFVHSTIGVVKGEYGKYKEIAELLSDLISIRNLARIQGKSNYLIERTKISTSESVLPVEYNNRILIIEEDEAMKLLLSTVLKLQGYEVCIISDFKNVDDSFIPAVIILDAGNNETRRGLSVCKLIKEAHIYKNSKLIVTSVFHDKESILMAGADLYLPKPYEAVSLVEWVKDFIEEYNN